MPIVDIDDTLPDDGVRINVKTREPIRFFRGEFVGMRFGDSKFMEALELKRSELAFATLGRNKTSV